MKIRDISSRNISTVGYTMGIYLICLVWATSSPHVKKRLGEPGSMDRRWDLPSCIPRSELVPRERVDSRTCPSAAQVIICTLTSSPQKQRHHVFKTSEPSDRQRKNKQKNKQTNKYPPEKKTSTHKQPHEQKRQKTGEQKRHTNTSTQNTNTQTTQAKRTQTIHK